jgi:molybdate transport system substrate-binding protein
MAFNRRTLLRALPALPVIAAATAANAATTDLVLTCDTTLAGPMTAAADRFYQQSRVRVRVFPTGPGLVLPQLERQIQNDLIFTRRGVAESAMQANLIAPNGLRGAWLNRLVLAGQRGSGARPTPARIAASDPTPASDMDGPAIIQALGLTQATVLGVIDTDEVAYLLLRGQVDAGLLHMTDIQANPALEVLRSVPNEIAPPIAYTAAVTKLAWRPDPQAFVDFLLTPDAAAVLRSAGLETAS